MTQIITKKLHFFPMPHIKLSQSQHFSCFRLLFWLGTVGLHLPHGRKWSRPDFIIKWIQYGMVWGSSMWEILVHQMVLFPPIHSSTRLERYVLCMAYLHLATLTWLQIYDSFSSFWSHAMTDIRDLVQTIYSWGNNRTLEITILYVTLLLTDDKFCCKDLEVCISLFFLKKKK